MHGLHEGRSTDYLFSKTKILSTKKRKGILNDLASVAKEVLNKRFTDEIFILIRKFLWLSTTQAILPFSLYPYTTLTIINYNKPTILCQVERSLSVFFFCAQKTKRSRCIVTAVDK